MSNAWKRDSVDKDDPIRIKILVLGPVKCGKTSIANFLADSTELRSLEYHPTIGARVLEFVGDELEVDGVNLEADIELWDCSGDLQYRKCWPAMREEAQGVILICNPEFDRGDDLLIWYEHFIRPLNMDSKYVLLLLHHTSDNTNDGNIAAFSCPHQLNKATIFPANIDHEGEHLKSAFAKFLLHVITDMKDSKMNESPENDHMSIKRNSDDDMGSYNLNDEVDTPILPEETNSPKRNFSEDD
uniref:Rab-like protein 5 n=1 Tax=Rhabditophanes sp. KR3021 TaxID=114890 RepID=A0AC35U6P1_9BILA